MIKEISDKDLINFKIKIGTLSSEKLCEIIVSNRYLGIMRDEAIMAMLELSHRRDLQDDFQYEKIINDLLVSMPKFKMDLSKIFRISKFV